MRALDEKFLKALHRHMFGDVWKWAGLFRTSERTGWVRHQSTLIAAFARHIMLQCSRDAECPDELLTFIETAAFTRRVHALGLGASVERLQAELLANPEAGDVEPGTGGLRKIRIGDPSRGKGKRGGVRVHYLWLEHKGRIYLIFAYAKDELTTLTAEQKRHLRALATKIRDER